MFKRLLCAAVLAISAAFISPVTASDQIQVSVGSAYKGAVDVDVVRGSMYIHAAGVFRLIGGVTNWYGRSGKLSVRLKDWSGDFREDESVFKSSSGNIKMSGKAVLSGGKLFVPVDFFMTPQFRKALGKDIAYNELAHSLDIDPGYQLGEMDYFTFRNISRVSFELKNAASYKADEKNSRHIAITVPNATSAVTETVTIGDGIVKTVNIRQDGSAVRVDIVMDVSGDSWTVTHENDTLEIEVASKSALNEIAKNTGAADESKPVSPPVKHSAPVKTPATASKDSFGPEEQELASETASRVKPAPPVSVANVLSGKRLLVIDAGHGGKDPGGAGRKISAEKHLNLAVARELESIARKDGRFEVLMTRTSDYFVTLSGRSDFSNKHQADLFVSVHANASKRKKDNGFEVYYMSEEASDPWAAQVAAFENAVKDWEKPTDDTASILLRSMARNEFLNEASQLAGHVAKNMEKKISIDSRGAKQAPFYVLRGTYAPAILVEIGFMTSPKDAKELSSKKSQKALAEGIYNGILAYAKQKGWE